MKPGFSHLDEGGKVRMVDVGTKDLTRRQAVAEATVQMSAEAYAGLRSGTVAKGDVLATVRLAGIQAAKRTSDLIPLCHMIPLDTVEIESRRSAWTAPEPHYRMGVLAKYAKLVSSASLGAVTD